MQGNRRETADSDTVDATLAGSLESLDDALNYRDWIVDLAARRFAAQAKLD